MAHHPSKRASTLVIQKTRSGWRAKLRVQFWYH